MVSVDKALQVYEDVLRDLDVGRSRAACVELAALMRWTGPQGKLVRPEHPDPADFEPAARNRQPVSDEAQVWPFSLLPVFASASDCLLCLLDLLPSACSKAIAAVWRFVPGQRDELPVC